ncbi:MAG: putative alcohol dehydrogenase AdhA [Chlamydiae bacterium]|nr:putative alcohol dehydrogenase AdhA [Chlamydiota bacterium]
MVLKALKAPLELEERPIPVATHDEILLKVKACAVCRTDLHIIDGEVPATLPLIPGHQIIGEVIELGSSSNRFQLGDRVGLPWLGHTCGKCAFCRSGAENLCDKAIFTGLDRSGGFAEYCTAKEDFSFPLPDGYPDDAQAAPLLCAGMIGYRAYRMAEGAERLGLYGFGASAHLLIQLACYEGKECFVFTRPGDEKTQKVAREMGAIWAGDSTTTAPELLDAALIFAPVGPLIPEALKAVRKGGSVISAGIHMSDIPSFPYKHLFGERIIRSVANLTRRDGEEFLALAPKVPIAVQVKYGGPRILDN